MQHKKRILVICPFPQGVAAGQRLKYEQYFDDWTGNGYDVVVSNFMDNDLWEIVYFKNGTERASFIIKGSVSSFYYSKKLNTIVTNRYLGTLERKHVLRLDLTGYRDVKSGKTKTTLSLANDWIKIQHRRN